MLPEDFRVVEARIRAVASHTPAAIAPATVEAVLVAALGQEEADRVITASDTAARVAAKEIASAQYREDATVLLAGYKRMRNAIDRALRECPYCMGGYCRAEAHEWLRNASGWQPPL